MNLSGEGPFFEFAALDDGWYSCRAQVSGNTYPAERDRFRSGRRLGNESPTVPGEMAEGEARISIEPTSPEEISAPDRRGEWSTLLGGWTILYAPAAAVTGEARFGFREGRHSGGGVYVNVDVEQRARWSLSCEPDATQ